MAQADLVVPVDLVDLVATVRVGPKGAAVAMARADPVGPPVTTAPEGPVDLVVPVDPVDLATTAPEGPVDPVDLATTDRADPVDPATTDRADPVDPATTAQVDPVDLVDPATTDRADPVDPATTAQADPVGPVGPAADGMEILSVATSTGNRGETEPRPGDGVRRLGQTGADRSRRPVGAGLVARSTTGAIRKLPSGIPDSTRGASGSSEFGFRCKESNHAASAWPIGRADVVFLEHAAAKLVANPISGARMTLSNF